MAKSTRQVSCMVIPRNVFHDAPIDTKSAIMIVCFVICMFATYKAFLPLVSALKHVTIFMVFSPKQITFRIKKVLN